MGDFAESGEVATTDIRAIHRGVLDWPAAKAPRNSSPCRVRASLTLLGTCYAKSSVDVEMPRRFGRCRSGGKLL